VPCDAPRGSPRWLTRHRPQQIKGDGIRIVQCAQERRRANVLTEPNDVFVDLVEPVILHQRFVGLMPHAHPLLLRGFATATGVIQGQRLGHGDRFGGVRGLHRRRSLRQLCAQRGDDRLRPGHAPTPGDRVVGAVGWRRRPHHDPAQVRIGGFDRGSDLLQEAMRPAGCAVPGAPPVPGDGQ